MILLIYVLTLILALIPFSLITRFIVVRSDIDSVIREINELSSKAAKTSPKEKRVRLIMSRYEYLKRRIRNLFLINMFILWIAIFVAITMANTLLAYLVSNYNVASYFNSPISLPIISVDGHVNVLIIILAAIIAYQPLHNKVSLMYKVYGST